MLSPLQVAMRQSVATDSPASQLIGCVFTGASQSQPPAGWVWWLNRTCSTTTNKAGAMYVREENTQAAAVSVYCVRHNPGDARASLA